ACHDRSTGNLGRHVKGCVHAQDNTNQLTVAQFARGSTYTHGKLRTKQVRWVCESHRPFTIVEDAGYRDICTMLNSNVKFVSRQTLS
ncbi:hypothetical protein K435DRAFT_608080, partial [Dendrothele bispora CBS 962.96]